MIDWLLLVAFGNERKTYFFLRGLSELTLDVADVIDDTVTAAAAAAAAPTADATDVDGLAIFNCFFFLSLALRLSSSCCHIVKR